MIPKARVWMGSDRHVWYWKCTLCMRVRDVHASLRVSAPEGLIIGGVGATPGQAGDLARWHLQQKHGWEKAA